MQKKLPFTKMHGTGNDYIFLDTITHDIPSNADQLAIAMSDRHTGIGADGLILIHPSSVADARMQMFNADGSEAEMCGNGLRCVGKYLFDHNICRQKSLKIETLRGILNLSLVVEKNKVNEVCINMGKPIFDPAKIPTTLEGSPPVNVKLFDGEGFCDEILVTTLSMGNPHCVLFVEEFNDELVTSLGSKIEHHPAFPNRVNVGFAKIESPSQMQLRLWERGCGETLACGTGACAAVVAAVLTRRASRTVTCHMSGGTLQIEWKEGGDVFLTGDVVEVFQGNWNPSSFC
ncbi:Diaminopimelate epimerase [hydrothermal vent metagenome]|uniref:diaminopimelate epimerase n=1 Tax=hydrothermal vent metagenome TaxID=652676 RepID=A0A3B1DMS6_9ZZZZ